MHHNKIKLLKINPCQKTGTQMWLCVTYPEGQGWIHDPPWAEELWAWVTHSSLSWQQGLSPLVWLEQKGSWAEAEAGAGYRMAGAGQVLRMAQLLLSTWKWFINKEVDPVSPRVVFCNTTQPSVLHLSSLSHGSYFCHQQSSNCLWPTAALHPALIFHSNRGEAQNPKEERKMGKVGYPLLETMNIHYNYYLLYIIWTGQGLL